MAQNAEKQRKIEEQTPKVQYFDNLVGKKSPDQLPRHGKGNRIKAKSVNQPPLGKRIPLPRPKEQAKALCRARPGLFRDKGLSTTHELKTRGLAKAQVD